MNKAIAELIGTFTLVFIACGAAVFAGSVIGWVGVSFAFGLALIGMAYGIGPISGCHINPAVSLGMYFGGRMSVKEMLQYWVAQVMGAILACLAIMIIAGSGPATGNFAANSIQDGYTIAGGLVFEIIATFLFVTVILGATQKGAATSMAGLAIGLMLVAIHLIGIPITNTSVNPARSIGPAIFSGGAAIAQLWIFIAAPLIGGALAGLAYKAGFTRASDDV
jgi:aquaporin Z